MGTIDTVSQFRGLWLLFSFYFTLAIPIAAQDVQLESIVSGIYWNSTKPSGVNDGWVWQGKGFTSEFGLRASASIPFVKLTLGPSVLWTQNSHFDQNSRVKTTIDLPDRIYRASESRVGLVNSSLFIEALNVRAGLSNENRWWGPGVRNSIILSNHAAGFDHVRVQTVKPQNIGIGTFYFEYITGRLIGTKIDPERYPKGWRLFNGIHVVMAPSFLPGLRVGLNRSFIANQQNVNTTADYFPLFQPFQRINLGAGTDGKGWSPDDQRVSLFFDWRFSESGFRTYAEFGREDHNADMRDAFLEPNHIRAYVIGLERISSQTVFQAEYTQTQVNIYQQARVQHPWYTHARVRRGYTQEGQVIGAAVGPGGNSLFIQYVRLHQIASTALFIERAEREVELAQRVNGPLVPKEVDYLVGIRHTREFGRLTVIPEMELMHTQNQFNISARTERNLAIRMRLGYRL